MYPVFPCQRPSEYVRGSRFVTEDMVMIVTLGLISRWSLTVH
jgi:hypothetical protein